VIVSQVGWEKWIYAVWAGAAKKQLIGLRGSLSVLLAVLWADYPVGCHWGSKSVYAAAR